MLARAYLGKGDEVKEAKTKYGYSSKPRSLDDAGVYARGQQHIWVSVPKGSGNNGNVAKDLKTKYGYSIKPRSLDNVGVYARR